ncbi:MAG: hypothetical protein JO303_17350 [Caulobacteraceae bacterium]|nr:hypothetical protein [Caulobacteraceae bacterium]
MAKASMTGANGIAAAVCTASDFTPDPRAQDIMTFRFARPYSAGPVRPSLFGGHKPRRRRWLTDNADQGEIRIGEDQIADHTVGGAAETA